MSEHIIYPKPTVKEVHFEVRFPHIFSIENRIGDIQLAIFDQFPESKLIFTRSILFVDKGPESDMEKIDDKPSRKIWKFSYQNKYELNIFTNKIGILSKVHTSYNLGKKGENFRDVIEYVLENFFDLIPIKTVSRVGLRYLDVGPLPDKNNDVLQEYYNTTFPINRFDLENVITYEYGQVSKIDDVNYIYKESLIEENDEYKIRLDYDTFIENVKVVDILKETDRLHDVHKKEWHNTLKEPVYKYMRDE